MTYPPGPELDSLLQRGYRYALSLAHDAVQAEDLLQDACLRLSDRGGPWEIGYLLRVIRNRSIDQHRRRGKIRFMGLGAAREPEASDCTDQALGDPMSQALGRLRPDEREAIYLTVVEGYTAAEAAALTERPRGTVLSLVHRAKEKLRRALGTAAARDAS